MTRPRPGTAWRKVEPDSTSRFVLAKDLSAPGAIAIDEAWARVEARWTEQAELGRIAARTVVTTSSTVAGFVRFCDGRVDTLGEIDGLWVERWIQSHTSRGNRAPATSTKRGRRAALRVFFATARVLGLYEGDPTLDVELDPRPGRIRMPLEEDQAQRCRDASFTSSTQTRIPLMTAFALATATASEIACIGPRDVDRPNCRVWAHSDGPGGPCQRWLYLDEWGVKQLDRRLAVLEAKHGKDLPDDLLLVFTGEASSSVSSRSSTVGVELRKVLDRAGLRGLPGVRAMSMAEYGGMKVWNETSDVVTVAARIGAFSLDAVAELLELDWITPRMDEPEHAADLPGYLSPAEITAAAKSRSRGKKP